MFFGNFAILEFLFNKVAGLKACSFIKKRLQRRCFLVKSAKDHLFYRTLPVAASGNIWWTHSLFITYENNESCHCVVRIGSTKLISFYCVCLASFYFFHFFLFFFVDFTTCLGIEVSLSILQIKHWSCS